MRHFAIATFMLLASLLARAESEDQCTDRCYEELGECEYVCQEKIGCQTKCATKKVTCEKDCGKKSNVRDFNVGYVSRKTTAAYSYAYGLRMAASDANASSSRAFSMRIRARIQDSSSDVVNSVRVFCEDPTVSVVVIGDAVPDRAPVKDCNKPFIQIGDSSAFARAQSNLKFDFGADLRRQTLAAAERVHLTTSSAKVALILPFEYDDKKFADDFASAVARKRGSVHFFTLMSNGSLSSRLTSTAPGDIQAIIHMARPDSTSTFVVPQGYHVSGGAVHFIPDELCSFVSREPSVCIRPGADLSSRDGREFSDRMNEGLRSSLRTISIDPSVEYAAIGFDLGKVLITSRSKSGSDLPDLMVKAIRDYSGSGLSGPISFDYAGVRKIAPVVFIDKKQ